ncbi:hypothetical protein SDC9_192410 [bioreactor metagenome]|uniref:Uncharacterized protein n=1 Tax=bioreactor metagenome TaxID=1076179 RepID=A0A645IBN1_9ZZZZ
MTQPLGRPVHPQPRPAEKVFVPRRRADHRIRPGPVGAQHPPLLRRREIGPHRRDRHRHVAQFRRNRLRQSTGIDVLVRRFRGQRGHAVHAPPHAGPLHAGHRGKLFQHGSGDGIFLQRHIDERIVGTNRQRLIGVNIQKERDHPLDHMGAGSVHRRSRPRDHHHRGKRPLGMFRHTQKTVQARVIDIGEADPVEIQRIG